LGHVLFVGFVVLGLVMIFAGGALGWRWVRNPWLRLAHLLAIGVVVLQSWLGVICPLTTLENRLRVLAGQEGYAGGFIDHYLVPVIYPPGLTRSHQLWMAGGVLLLNLIVYALVLRRAHG
jgi:hypothetical protein